MSKNKYKLPSGGGGVEERDWPFKTTDTLYSKKKNLENLLLYGLDKNLFLSWTLSTQIEINRSGTRSTVHPGRQTMCIDLRSKCKHLHAIFLIKKKLAELLKLHRCTFLTIN